MKELEIYNTLVQWKKETNIKYMGIKIRYTKTEVILEIYSDKAGPLIGKAGSIIFKYQKILKEYGIDKVEIGTQLDGFIGDEELTFEEYYKDYIDSDYI